MKVKQHNTSVHSTLLLLRWPGSGWLVFTADNSRKISVVVGYRRTGDIHSMQGQPQFLGTPADTGDTFRYFLTWNY